MTLKDIAWLNLRRRKAKALFVLAGLMIGVATMVALVSLVDSLSMEINHKLEKYGANILITPRSEELALSYEGMSLGGFSFQTKEIAQADLAGIEKIKNAANVAAVGPMVLGPVEAGGRRVLLAGYDFSVAPVLKPWWQVTGALPQADQVLAGTEAARVLKLKPGDRVEVGGRSLTVSGVLGATGSQDDRLLFTDLSAAQAMLNKPGLVSMVEVAALCKDCPVEDMVTQISQVLPGARVMAIQSVVKGRMEFLAQFRQMGLGVSAIVLLVGCLVVLVTMMGAVKERTGEIGIMRALGFRKGHVARVVLMEAALISAAAGVLGWLGGIGAGRLALPLFSPGSEGHLTWDPLLAGGALVLAVVVGMASSLYPAWMAARLDPSTALRTL